MNHLVNTKLKLVDVTQFLANHAFFELNIIKLLKVKCSDLLSTYQT